MQERIVMKIGQKFIYAGVEHTIKRVKRTVVITYKGNGIIAVWHREGLKIILDNPKYYE